MAPLRLCTALALATFTLDAAARYAPAYRIHQAHKHEARDLGKRQVGPPYMPAPRQAVPTTSETAVLTYITPSPGAKPIAVTEQSQYVTSFIPQYTLCELPPLAFFSASLERPSTVASTAPYRNYSISVPEGNGTCTTVYKPTRTMVCATTLTGLFDKWTVSKCDQDLTFSTQYGYVLVTPTPKPAAAATTPSLVTSTSAAASVLASSTSNLNDTLSNVLNGTNSTISSIALVAPRQASLGPAITSGPSIETLTTYYFAAWQELTAGTVPSDIDLKVCRTYPNGTEKCIREYESWHTSLVTKTTSSVTSVNISTTIHGLSQIIVETYVANVTELLTTFSMSTTIDKEFVTEIETTHVTTREPTTTYMSTSPTVYRTLTVARASETGSPSEDITSTITIRQTSTIIAETRTTTLPSVSASLPAVTSPSAPQVPAALGITSALEIDSGEEEVEVTVEVDPPSSTNWASMLAVGQPGDRRVRR